MVAVLVRAIVISLICVSLGAQAAYATDNRIIVQPIANSTGDESLDPLSAGFSDLLVAYLSGYGELEILYRDDMHRIWQELAQSGSGLQRTDAMQIGALIQANKLIKGGFVKINGTFQANVHIYDIATTQLQYSLAESGDIESVDTLASAMAQSIADKLLNHANSATSMLTDAQPLINTHFMKGLGYHYNGLYDHAVAEFMQVIDLDPGRADARMWLGKSYTAGGEHDHAQIEFERFLQDFPHHEYRDSVRNALDRLSGKSKLP